MSSQLIGYSYFLDMAYAFTTEVDSFLGFYFNGNKNWSGAVSSSGTTISTKTGLNSEVQGSAVGKSNVTLYTGAQTTDNSYLSSKTGMPLAYKDICYAVFPQAFIGDNVRNVPTYGVLLQRTNIKSCSSIPSYNTYKTIIGTKDGTIQISNANPAFIIYDILVTLLKINTSNIDSTSFSEAAATLYGEKLGMNMVISISKKGIDWINEILRYINGTLYFNTVVGKYYLKLFREDYIVDELPVVNEDIASEITFIRPSRADLPNTFTFKYANITGSGVPKSDSLSLTNQANLTLSGFTKNVEVDLTCINTSEALNLLTTFFFKKLSYPLASLTFRISPIDFPSFQVGEPFVFADSKLTDESGMIFRVIKVTGDSVKDDYFNIEAIEDIFGVTNTISVSAPTPVTTSPSYELDNAPTRMKVISASPEDSLTKAVYVFASYQGTTSFIRSLIAYELDSSRLEISESLYGTVTTITNLSGMSVDYDVIIRVENLDETMYEVTASNIDFQRLVYTAYWGNEAIGFKTCTKISDTIFEFSGIIRGIHNRKTSHSIGETFWVATSNANQVPPLKITSLTPTIKVYAENTYDVSPELSQAYTYDFNIETPYPINGLKVIAKGGSADLQWTPCVRLKGANFRNCDTIVAGQDEGVVEGVFNIYKDNVLVYTYTPTSSSGTTYMTYNITQAGTWAVETQLSTYKSSKVSIVVSPTDVA